MKQRENTKKKDPSPMHCLLLTLSLSLSLSLNLNLNPTSPSHLQRDQSTRPAGFKQEPSRFSRQRHHVLEALQSFRTLAEVQLG
jgi:hypothetical protein